MHLVLTRRDLDEFSAAPYCSVIGDLDFFAKSEKELFF